MSDMNLTSKQIITNFLTIFNFRMRVVRGIINTVLIAGLCRVLLGHSQMARNMWYLLLHMIFQVVRLFRTALPMLKAK